MIVLVIVICFILLLFFPQTVLTGATNGLNLWFYNIIPALLPAMLLTQLSMRLLNNQIKQPFAFSIFVGLLCGYPIGALSMTLSGNKNSILMPYINVASPAFLINYAVIQGLTGRYKLQLLLSIYISIGLCITVIIVCKFLYKSANSLHNTYIVNFNNQHSYSFIELIDESINSTLEAILKLGLYIIINSVICNFIMLLPMHINLKAIICGFIEITTGIFYLSMTTYNSGIKLILIAVLCALGGVSCLMQTTAVAGTNFNIKKYIRHKLILASVTGLVSTCIAYVYKIL